MNSTDSPKELRKFGLTVGIAFGLLAALFAWRGRPWWIYAAGLSAFLIVFGLVLPAALKPVRAAWMRLALAMSWVMTRVILSVLFYLVVTPIGLIMRLTGKDPLNTDFSKKQASYWVPRAPRDNASYTRQF